MFVRIRNHLITLLLLHRAHAFLPTSHRNPQLRLYSTEQAEEAIASFSEFHLGTWRGTARSFTVTDDVAAGIVQRKTSPEYQVSVALNDLTLSESYSFSDDDVSARKVNLNEASVDIDSVDASYTLDCRFSDDLPQDLTGTGKFTRFTVEHVIALSDDDRARMLAMYGPDDSLTRLVVCEETRIGSKASRAREGGSTALSAGDILEMNNDVERLVSKLTGEDLGNYIDKPKLLSDESPKSSTDPPSTGKLSKHPAKLIEISAGVWLGDVVIRDFPKVPLSPLERGQGFGPTKASPPSSFAEWSVGVQKIAFRWMWNFGEEIRQVNDVGRSMGAELVEPLSKSLSGNVCVNEGLSRRLKPEERMCYIDWSNDNVGFLIGSYAIQVPRYLTFDTPKTSDKPFITEFSAFQSSAVDNEEEELPELICSRSTRVYNFEGKLKQGCTSFYQLKRFGAEKDDL